MTQGMRIAQLESLATRGLSIVLTCQHYLKNATFVVQSQYKGGNQRIELYSLTLANTSLCYLVVAFVMIVLLLAGSAAR